VNVRADFETGGQPSGNEDGSIPVTQNGEIHNHVEVLHLLEARGHTFRSGGDTETIVHLCEEHGDGSVDHLRGMFAIAVWDDQSTAASLLDEHRGGAVDHGRCPWLLISFELWARRWLRGRTEAGA
jgi:asparagine synthase (glutamine-hydrolysing)